MKKILLTLTTVGLLGVPAGMAVAQDETPDPTPPVTTCDQDRDRVRDRVQDQEQVVVQDQVRTQQRLGDGTCDGDCPGTQVRERDQVESGDPVGSMTRTRQGAMGRS